jgi:hypothetical protein
MAVSRWSFLMCLAAVAVAWPPAASGAPPVDKAKLDELRSVVAEAAALQAVEARGLVTSRYGDGLHTDLRRDLRKLVSDPRLGPAAREGLAALDHRDAAGLAHCRDLLVALERSHGRAG